MFSLRTTRILGLTSVLFSFKCQSHDFFHRLLTFDETWIRYDNPKRKNQWLSSGQPPQTTPKPDIHGKKIMLCYWWNSNGLVHYELLKPGETVTSDLYVKQLIRGNEALKTLGLRPLRTCMITQNCILQKSLTKKLRSLAGNFYPTHPTRLILRIIFYFDRSSTI